MVTRAAIVAVLFLLPLVVRAQPRPSYSVQPGGVVAAALPLSILSERDVRKQLGSGLTTTFLLVARNRGNGSVSGARMEVRYDLWDEVWIVRRVDFDRKADAQRIATRDALEKWWRTPLRLLATGEPRVSLQLDLSVLPFSAAEKEDARQWMSKSGGVVTPGGSSGSVIDALIGTTIDAKPITAYRWNVELALK